MASPLAAGQIYCLVALCPMPCIQGSRQVQHVGTNETTLVQPVFPFPKASDVKRPDSMWSS